MNLLDLPYKILTVLIIVFVILCLQQSTCINAMDSKYNARFFTYNDEKQEFFMSTWQLPKTWWSRPYEYAWAAQFAEDGDIALDAACGIEHPLKFFLARKCKSVYACDIDPRILNKEEVLLQTAQSFSLSENQTDNMSTLYDAIKLTCEDLSRLSYSDQTFDKIYCISVLEHLERPIFEKTLIEFRRILKDNGLIVLTFDYPSINLQMFQTTIRKIGLKIIAESPLELPQNAIYSEFYKLFCFRAILIKS